MITLAVQLALANGGKAADASATNPPVVLPELTVVGSAETGSLTSPSLDSAAEQKKEISGGFSLRPAEAMEQGRASDFTDLLDRTPGLELQTENGTEATRVSMRGSGVLSEDEPSGVQFLLDGLSLNQGDGEAILEDFDLATIQYAEVYRGANAFKYGSIALGGAINLVTRTGCDADRLRLRVEGGSYGYLRGQASAGGFEGPVDYVGSLMGRYRDGFREHSRENTERLFADLGYRISDNLENRFYVTTDRVDRQVPGGLTKEEMKDNPRQAAEDAIAGDFNKKWDFIRLADKVSFNNNGHELDAGAFWFHRNLEERGFFADDFRRGITAFYSDNFGLALNSVTHGELFGRPNVFTVGVSPQAERQVTHNFENLAGHRGQITAHDTDIAVNAPLFAENQFYFAEGFSLLTGIQLIYATRRFEDHFVTDDQGDQSHDQDFYGWNPQAGLIYELDPRNQFFMNFSGSWQPPSFDNMVEFVEGTNSSVVYTPLRPQRAWTLELGTRGARGAFAWELSLYRSWLRHELLELNDALGNDRGAVNVNCSFHQGIEAGLEIELLDIASPEPKPGAGSWLTFSQAYTLNDFHFEGDPVYGNNRIAGLPVHLLEAELLYTAACGFFAGPNVRCNLTRYPVDQANTLFADPYALLGLKIGLRTKKGFSIFFDARNLTDERFPSAVSPIADARIEPDAEVFHPGDGRSFYGGVSWSWQ